MPGSVPFLHRLRRSPSAGRRVRRAGLVLGCVAALDGLCWLAAQRVMDRALDGWTTRLARQGWSVQAGPRARGGSPLTARITLRSPRLHGPIGRRSAAWGADGLAISVSWLHPGTLRVGLIGTQALRLSGPDRAGLLALRGRGQDADITLPLALRPDAPGGQAAWSARRLDVRVLDPAGHETGFRLDGVQGHGLWNDQAGPDASRLALAVTADRVDLPLNWPLIGSMPPTLPDPRRLHDAGVEVAFPGPTPGDPSAHMLLQDAHATWSTLSLHLVGHATLPPTGGPDGTFTLSLTGIGTTIHALEQSGTVPRDLARAVTALDRWAAETGADGPAGPSPATPVLSDRRLDLPLRLRAGGVFLGTLPIGSIADDLP
ncbi:conserved hypothetical protein [Gluconacetobacter diazotrophicus PA1 5]|nr:DUF2125 domain-containing protein [Gluconacetobacter diazotrophicus]ACI52798.1 conserved hypothetical protein [Gluconacetobacter diazotrophicus PA1 5]TWB09057.1 uncharacterized protein DUF2125 [Gluconacetobacter diazotrophicus]